MALSRWSVTFGELPFLEALWVVTDRCPGDSSRRFRNTLASALSAQALGTTHLIRGMGSPTECLVGGRAATRSDSWVRHCGDSSGERARPSTTQEFQIQTHAWGLSQESCYFYHLCFATCPCSPTRRPFPLGPPPGCETCARSPLLLVLAIPRIV